MKKWIKRIIILLVLIAVVVAIVYKPKDTVSYRTSEAKKGNIETIVSGSGALAATKEKKEYAKVSAQVEEVYHKEGERVEKDTPIIKLDSSKYESTIKTQEIAIKQTELSKSSIEKQIRDLEIKSDTDGYVTNLALTNGTFVTNTMGVCDIVKDNKFQVVLQFTYYENNPITIGTNANVSLVDSMTTMVGTVTKVSDMRKLISGNAQVIDVTIEVETPGYSLEGANAKAELSNGVTVLQSTNMSNFTRINSNIIRAKSTGTVKKVYVVEGQKVKAGDKIALLENSDLETNLQNVKLNLENLNNQLKTMKDQLEDYIITAPIDGVITSQDIEKGDMVAAGTLLTSISDKDTMKFVIPIDELDIAKINYDQEVRVKIDALDETENNPLNGKITDIPEEGVTVAGVTDYYVTIQVSGNQSMKISMNANADIVINSVKDVLTIPVDSIIKENGKKYVDVLLQDGVTVERKEIETGASDITNIEVKSGLEEGEKVIIPEVNSGISFFM